MNGSANKPWFYAIKFFIILIPIGLFWWVNRVLETEPTWNWILLLMALVGALPLGHWIFPNYEPTLKGVLFILLTGVGLWVARFGLTFHLGLTIFFLLTVIVVALIGLLVRRPEDTANLALMAFGLLFAIVIANIGSGFVLRGLEAAAAAESAAILDSLTAGEEIAAELEPEATPKPTIPLEPTATPDSIATPTVQPTPEPTRPIAGFGYLEWIEDNGEPDWVQHTGFGPRVNSTARAYMYDVNGNIVYDTALTYNGKGYRGPEASYDKPDNTYRILIIGDSFVESIQVPYEKTFQALLQDQLNEVGTSDKQYEVIAMGRTGWGTVHETAYYQIEGYKYSADLVILMFYVNDVADNFPRFFYPNINNTNFEFVFERDFIQILDTEKQPLPPNNGRKLYNALPAWIQNRNISQLYINMIDPAVPVMTPGGPMTRVHPQFYIYVSEPEIEGYPEAWDRTAEALRILAEGTAFNGSQLAVVPIFLGDDMVENISNWFPEETAGWEWNPAEPEERLDAILSRYPAAEMWPLRPYYEAYAGDEEIFRQIYLPEDFHFNELGHVWTADALFGHLENEGIVEQQGEGYE